MRNTGNQHPMAVNAAFEALGKFPPESFTLSHLPKEVRGKKVGQ